jgi:hypothetical protein
MGTSRLTRLSRKMFCYPAPPRLSADAPVPLAGSVDSSAGYENIPAPTAVPPPVRPTPDSSINPVQIPPPNYKSLV